MNPTPSELYVSRLTQTAFFPLWSYSHPRRSETSSKELCDILVVCYPDVLIFSVKDAALGSSGDQLRDWDRWTRTALRASEKQVFGAERRLRDSTHVIRQDGKTGLTLPPLDVRRIHRIAVAFGGQGKVPIAFSNSGKGLVHVLDETGLDLLVRELDTIEDFVCYLRAKEAMMASGPGIVFYSGEEDLLAVYLSHGRLFPQSGPIAHVDPTSWKTFSKSAPYLSKKRADEPSYTWDTMLLEMSEQVSTGSLASQNDLDSTELGIRTMARENRTNRRILSSSFLEFLRLARDGRVRSRLTMSPSGTGYVFVAGTPGEDKQERAKEMFLRCYVARGLLKQVETIVAIGTEAPNPRLGRTYEIGYFNKPTWTEEDASHMQGMQADLGFWVRGQWKNGTTDEYPSGGEDK